MKQLTLSLFHICLFKNSPQDLPASGAALRFTLFATLFIFVIRNWLLTGGDNAFSIAAAQIFLLGASLWLLLKLFSKAERWTQSAIALFGCSAIIVTFVILFLLTAGKSPNLTSESLSLVKQ